MTEEEELQELIDEAMAELDESEEEIDESEEEETEDEKASEDESEDITEENKEEETEDTNEVEEEEETTGEFTPIDVDVGGHSVTIESKEQMMEYIRKGASTFNKTETHQEEKVILDQGKLTSDDLKLLVEAKNGSKEAIAKLAEMGKVDTLDIDEDTASQYRQQIQYNTPNDVDKVANEIMQDKELASSFRTVTSNLPKDFMNAISTDATLLKDFSGHIKSGLAQEIIPKAINASMTNGKSFMDNYASLGQEIFNSKQATAKEERTVSAKEKSLRKRASSSKGSTSTKTVVEADDIAEMSDEDFQEYMANFTE